MIALYVICLVGAAGIIKYLLIPVALAVKHGLLDGYNNKNDYKHLYTKDVKTLETLETDNTSIEDEIAHLESMVDRYNEMSIILENELELCSNDKKRLVLLNRLNTIDSQTFRIKKKIDTLMEKLE